MAKGGRERKRDLGFGVCLAVAGKGNEMKCSAMR